MTYKYIVIGGGIAGTNAAFAIRKHDPEGGILIIGDEPFPLYSRVSLGKIMYDQAGPDKITLKPSEIYDKNLIDTSFGKRVVSVDHSHKLIELSDGSYLGYEKLLLATGGSARTLPLDGMNKQGVFYFQTMFDAMKGASYIEDKHKMMVIGGGFIGIEFVDIFHKMNKELTLLVREPWYWSLVVLPEGGEILDQYIRSKATVLYETEVNQVLGEDMITGVTTNNGQEYQVDALFVGVGIKLNYDFLVEGQIKTRRGIITNEFLQTSLKDVYAAGDVAEYYDPISEQYLCGGTWAGASLQGLIAGHNMTHPLDLKPFQFVPAFCPKISLPVAFIGQCQLSQEVQAEVLENSPKRYVQGVFREDILIGVVLMKDSSLMGMMTGLVRQKATSYEVRERLMKV